jgi:hypothetical protein
MTCFFYFVYQSYSETSVAEQVYYSDLVRYLDLNTLQDFKWQVAIGDQVLTIEEFEKLIKEKRSVLYKFIFFYYYFYPSFNFLVVIFFNIF